MIRNLALLLLGSAAGSILLFARNLLVARLVSVEDYGIAATFALTMSVVELASNLGLQQLIVQNRDGDDPAFQAQLQGFHLLRSILGAGVLFLVAGPIAQFLSVPEVAWAYRALAVVPILNGLQHFDVHRFMRSRKFVPVVAIKLVPAAIGLAVILPFYRWFGGFQVMLYSLIVQWAAIAVVSHILAERPYKLAFNGAFFKHAISFGWPLLINNILIFGALQGDRVIVGGNIGVASLGVFSMGVTLTMTPLMIFGASFGQFILPRLSSEQNRSLPFVTLTLAATEASILAGLSFVVAFILFGAPLIDILLGERYQAVIPLLVWLSLQQALRIAKTGVSQAAVAQARTSIPMSANLSRVVSLVPAWFVALNGGSLVAIIQIGILGELVGFAVSLLLAKYWLGVGLRPLFLPLLAAGGVALVAVAHATSFGASMGIPDLAVDLASVLALIAAFASMGGLRQLALQKMQRK